jgi:GNAT superfamily N-acetyltransferase
MVPAEDVARGTLVEVFNQAFSDYSVEVSFNPRTFDDYVYRNLLDLRRSYVVEVEGRLVGTLLCGDDGRVTWNAGMGIHPRWRRRGAGSALLDRWIADSVERGLRSALLEVIVHNLGARYLYRSRGFEEGRSFQGFEGRPTWGQGPRLPPDGIETTTPEGLRPVYRTCHSFQKRDAVLLRLKGFTCWRTRGPVGPGGPGYLVVDDYGGMLYVFDMTPNAAGRALLEHAVRAMRPRLIRVINACEHAEEDLYRALGFRPWVRNLEMRLDLARAARRGCHGTTAGARLGRRQRPRPPAARMSASRFASMDPPPKTAEPATSTSAPASTASRAVLVLTPPSTSRTASGAWASSIPRALAILGSIAGMKLWPEKPGLTVITSSRSMSASTYSTADSGVEGFTDTPDLLPSSRMRLSVRCRWGHASACTVM